MLETSEKSCCGPTCMHSPSGSVVHGPGTGASTCCAEPEAVKAPVARVREIRDDVGRRVRDLIAARGW
jgi:hypothetical protein